MSKTLLIIGSLLGSAMLAVGCWSLMQGEEKLFFLCAIGSFFVFLLLYIRNFFQSLNPPKANNQRFRTRGLKEEAQALAEANPQHPGLRRLFGWLVVGMVFVVILRVIQLVSS